MEHTPKQGRQEKLPPAPTAVIAAKVHELRTERGWSADQLAAKMRALGIEWTRLVVTKMEKGYRQSVSVDELLALAHVLDVAPVNLLVPWDDDARCWVAPRMPPYPAKRVRRWVRGWPHSAGLPGGDPKRYVANTPPSEDDIVFVPENEYQELMEGRPSQRAVTTYEQVREQRKGRDGDGGR